ncbi:MAG: ELWxxDGT repeat protein [Pirellulaceae bacterium]
MKSRKKHLKERRVAEYCQLEPRQLMAGVPQLIDIRPGGGSAIPYFPGSIGNWMFFSADGPTGGRELWKSDGTTAGTTLVKDINPNPSSASSHSDPRSFTNVNNTVFFSADDGTTGRNLWKSDGTLAGTVMVKDISSITTLSVGDMANCMGTLFFVVGGRSLWKSDGTDAGTVPLREFDLGPKVQLVEDLKNVNGTLLFTAYDSDEGGAELWRSDGTVAGTVRVKDIFPGTYTSPGGTRPNSSTPDDLTNVNGTLFFTAQTSAGRELWKSDGTDAGTVRVLEAGIGGPGLRQYETFLTNVNGVLFFAYDNWTHGRELWRSDGTVPGTTIVADINLTPGTFVGTTLSSNPQDLCNVNGTLFFTAIDTDGNRRLFRSEGRSTSTQPIADVPIVGHDITNDAYDLVNVSGTLFFSSLDESGTRRAYLSDGTLNQTRGLSNTLEVPDFDPKFGLNVNGRYFFNAKNATSGYEMAVFDTGDEAAVEFDGVKGPFVKGPGVSFRGIVGAGVVSYGVIGTGTAPPSTPTDLAVIDIATGAPPSNPLHFTNVNGAMFFSAIGPSGDRELYRSNGAFATRFDLNVGLGSSHPQNLTNVNGDLYFTAETPSNGRELWKYDGTTGFTFRVRDIWGGVDGSTPLNLTNYNGRLFFSAYTPTHGRELWTTDGTNAGTVILKNINTAEQSSDPAWLTVSRNTLYFAATSVLGGRELFKSDGTATGTVLVKNINETVSPTIGSSNPSELIDVDGQLFFAANDGINGIELWRSNGSSAGTTMVSNINPTGSSNPANLTNVRGNLFFRATTSASGAELWRRNRWNGATEMVEEIAPGAVSSFPTSLTNVNGILAFVATTSSNGAELWRSNGTDAGTFIVKDIVPGTVSSSISNLYNHNGHLFFSANDGTNGAEVWKSRLTDATTMMVKDIRAGAASSSPTGFSGAGVELYFSADDGISGRELWVFRPDLSADMPPALMLAPNQLKPAFISSASDLNWASSITSSKTQRQLMNSSDERNFALETPATSRTNSPTNMFAERKQHVVVRQLAANQPSTERDDLFANWERLHEADALEFGV